MPKHRQELVLCPIRSFELRGSNHEGSPNAHVFGDVDRCGHHSVDLALSVPQRLQVELEEAVLESAVAVSVEADERLGRYIGLSVLVDAIQDVGKRRADKFGKRLRVSRVSRLHLIARRQRLDVRVLRRNIARVRQACPWPSVAAVGRALRLKRERGHRQ